MKIEKKLQQAQQLLQQQRYNEARALLATIDHPTAREWEQHMNQMGLGLPPATAYPPQYNAGPAPTEKPSLLSKPWGWWKRGSKKTRSTMLGCLMIFTCISCVCGFSMGQSLGIIPKYSATYDAETRVYRETREADQTHEAATAAVLALTPSATPTPTDTPTRTLTPTNTLTPTDTLTPTNTNTPRVSPTSTATQTLPSTTRPTQTPANTSRPAATAVQVTPRSAQTYYAISNANLRPCPRTVASCAPEVALAPGDEITVTGTIQGEAVSGNTTWYQVEYRNQTLYAHSSVLSPNRPVAPAAPAAPANSGNDSGGNTVQSTVPPAAPGWNCNGDVYNCGDFSTCAEAMSYLSACPDDQSRLDANNDDVPCESLCK